MPQQLSPATSTFISITTPRSKPPSTPSTANALPAQPGPRFRQPHCRTQRPRLRIQAKGSRHQLKERTCIACKGRVAIVTGAGSGIGQGIAKRLGCEGAKVIVDYVGTPDGAEETERAIEQAGGQGKIVQADVTRDEDICKLVDAAWTQFGSADILVNNAGMEKKSDFWDTPEADYDKIMAVNLRGPFFLDPGLRAPPP